MKREIARPAAARTVMPAGTQRYACCLQEQRTAKKAGTQVMAAEIGIDGQTGPLGMAERIQGSGKVPGRDFPATDRLNSDVREAPIRGGS
jgi:hypothetical protein